MNYALVQNNEVVKVGLPTVGYLKNGSSVSGYNLLPESTLKAEGWLPIEDIKPVFDESTQQLQHGGYKVQGNKVVVDYMVVDKPIPVESVVAISIEDRMANLEDTVDILVLKQEGIL